MPAQHKHQRTLKFLVATGLLLGCLTDAYKPGLSVDANKPHSLRGATVVAYSSASYPARKALSTAVFNKHVHSVLQYYFSNSELESHMQDYVQRCGSISRMFSIGKSGNAAEMWALEISNAPGKLEAKPNFKYVANMHGDEPVGRQLQLALAEWLCAHWQDDAQAARIVNGMHFYLLPTMNPDGFAARKRGNSAHVDLNRDFPDPLMLGEANLTATGKEQPETLAIMKWANATRFVGSASMHEGAVVANYPWDGSPDRSTSYAACPDDAAFIHLAKAYSLAHGRMGQSSEFKNGITNGAAWYPLWGGMQDWNYLAVECMELTLELSQNKWPPATELPRLWEDNHPAMVNLALTAALGGLRGSVVGFAGGDSRGLLAASGSRGTPLPATITVKGINHTISAGPDFGDFYRPLAPGSYNVTASMEGYSPKSTAIVVPADNSGAILDFELIPVGAKDSQARDDDGRSVITKSRKGGPFGQVGGMQAQDQEVGSIWGRFRQSVMLQAILGVALLAVVAFQAAKLVRRRAVFRAARSPPR